MMNDRVTSEWRDDCMGVAHWFEPNTLMEGGMGRYIHTVVMPWWEGPPTLRVCVALFVVNLASCCEQPQELVEGI